MALIIEYTGPFIDAFAALDSELQRTVLAKIEEFKSINNHRRLRVHKLHGRLAGRYSFSVNFHYRIVFTYPAKNTARLHVVGNHSIYD